MASFVKGLFLTRVCAVWIVFSLGNKHDRDIWTQVFLSRGFCFANNIFSLSIKENLSIPLLSVQSVWQFIL